MPESRRGPLRARSLNTRTIRQALSPGTEVRSDNGEEGCFSGVRGDAGDDPTCRRNQPAWGRDNAIGKNVTPRILPGSWRLGTYLERRQVVLKPDCWSLQTFGTSPKTREDGMIRL